MTEPRKILVIDDNVAVTRLLDNILTQEGYTTIITNEPATGQLLVEQESPDLVVLDICMPDIDGWELCRRIRMTHAVPILVLSVRTNREDIRRTFDVGADAFMPKPFPIKEFLKRVSSLLKRDIRRLDAHEEQQARD